MRYFTLLELILVVFIMGLIASSALLVVNDFGDQERYDGNLILLESFRTSIVGNENKQGFVKDVGRLPIHLDEIFNNSLGIKEYSYDNLLGYSYGWRGPYIDQFDQEKYRDAWGFFFTGERSSESGDVTLFSYDLNEFGGVDLVESHDEFDPNYVGAGEAVLLKIISLGKDGSSGSGGDGYSNDKNITINNHDVYENKTLTFFITMNNLSTANVVNKNVKLMVLFPHDNLPETIDSFTSKLTLDPFLAESDQLISVPVGETLELAPIVFDKELSYHKIRIYMIDDNALIGTEGIEEIIIGNAEVPHHVNMLNESDNSISLEYKIIDKE